MIPIWLVLLVATVILGIYLFAAMLKPEKF